MKRSDDHSEIAAIVVDIKAVAANLSELLNRLQTALTASSLDSPSNPFRTPFKATSKAPLNAAQHLAQHRPGRPSRIDTDPELRAFIIDRIDRMTFPALEKAVADQFPPNRRVGKSAIHQWWQRLERSIPKSHPR